MRYVLTAAMVACALAQPAHAEQEPKPSTADRRVLYVEYNPEQVVLVVGGLRQSTLIKFADDEKIIRAAPGNDNAWAIKPVGNILFLRAREPHPRSSLHVVTERKDGLQRIYLMDLAVKEFRPTAMPPMLTVIFRYPADENAKKRAEAAQQSSQSKSAAATNDIAGRLADGTVHGPLNYASSKQGMAAYAPSEVFDNGRSTIFEFPGNVDMPAIYAVTASEDDTGSEELVPNTVQGRRVVIHAISQKFVLRQGLEVMCVYNEHYNAVGVNHGTQTASPTVVRTLKGMSQEGAASRATPYSPSASIPDDGLGRK